MFEKPHYHSDCCCSLILIGMIWVMIQEMRCNAGCCFVCSNLHVSVVVEIEDTGIIVEKDSWHLPVLIDFIMGVVM